MLEATDPASHGFAFAEPLILLLASVVGVAISRRLGLGSVLGYLAAGVVIGPVAQLITGAERDHAGRRARHRDVPVPDRAGAEAGAAVVDAGGHFRPRRLRRCVVTGAILAALFYMAGWRIGPAIIVGFGLAMSSTAFGMQVLTERGELDNALRPEGDRHPLVPGSRHRSAPRGRAARCPRRRRPFGTRRAVGNREGGGGARRAPPRADATSSTRSSACSPCTRAREVMTAAALLVVLGAAALMDFAGLSMAMGAFLAGLMLAEFGLPARARGRHRAVPQHPVRPLLHRRRHGDQRRQFPLQLAAHPARGRWS